MRRLTWMAALLLVPVAAALCRGGEPPCNTAYEPGCLDRWHPVGGWFPYGGGFLRWWNPHCFPRPCGPDDYCRKPLPHVCVPACTPCGTRETLPASRTLQTSSYPAYLTPVP